MPPLPPQLKTQLLADVSAVLHKALDLDQALEEALRILSCAPGVERATVTLADRDTGELAVTACDGPARGRRGQATPAPALEAARRILDTAAALHLPGDGADRPAAHTGVPIVLDAETVGALGVDWLPDAQTDTPGDTQFLAAVAALLAQMVRISEAVRRREEALRRENAALRYRVSKEAGGLYIIGSSTPMREVERLIEQLAPTDAPVLLLGEPGTGKTRIARIIHDLSGRKARPFVAVGCASAPGGDLESELFGCERGARPGRVEDAHQGTLLLDEIDALPPALQAGLLRVIQKRETVRAGGSRPRAVDVRILAATNRDLRELVDRGDFRLDLYHRLNMSPVTVPPLRRRKEDVPGLLNHFLRRAARGRGRTFFLTPGALEFLTARDWPGNVRELEGLVERLAVMAGGQRIDEALARLALNTASGPDGGPQGRSPGAAPPRKPSLKEMERAEILSALREARWIKRRAGEALGLTERQIGYRIRKLGLEDRVAAERARLRGAR
jgi:Nif-specific regulatory protein